MRLIGVVLVVLFATLKVVSGDDKNESPTESTNTAKPVPKGTEETTKCLSPTAISEKNMPKLNDTFETIIEAKFLKRPNNLPPSVKRIREYRSKDKGRSAVFTADKDSEKHVLFDLNDGHAFAFNVEADKCSGTRLDIGKEDLYFKFSVNKGSTGSMMGLQDIYDFSTKHGVVQTNDSVMVRNIECEEWTSCLQWARYDNYTFIVKWYWSKNDKFMPLMENKPTPVQVEVRGYDTEQGKTIDDESNLGYHHIYDFVSYSDKISDPSVLWPEIELLCDADGYYAVVNKDHDFPELPNTFSVDLEQITNDRITYGKYVMDSVNNLTRTDLSITEHDDDNDLYKVRCAGSLGICKIINDFNVGLEYIIKKDGSCSVYSIPMKDAGGKTLPQDVINHEKTENQSAFITMASAKDLFGLAAGVEMEYQGDRMFRGVSAAAWATKVSSPYDYNEFLMRDKKLWGVIRKSKQGDGVLNTKINFYNYDTAPDLSAFDIHNCFSNKDSMTKDQKERFQTVHARLELTDSWKQVRELGIVKVQTALRKIIAEKSGVNPLRIADMMIAQDKDEDVRVWFTILWASPITGSMVSADGPSIQQKDVEKAEDDLEKALKEDVVVTIGSDDNSKKVTIKGDSLKANDDALKGDPRPSQQTVVKTGHSNSSMAVLAIFMIILGAVVGLGVGFYLWRRRGRGVPYQIHH